MCEPSLPLRPGQLGEPLQRRVAPRRLVDLDHGVALPRRDRHRDDLLGQAALVGRGDRALVRAQRPAVHVGAGHLELVADLGRLLEHLLAAERVARARPGPSRRAPWRRPCGSRSGPWAAGTALATSTPCRRPTATSRSPARIAGRSCPTARMPDAQTLLIVSEVTSFGMPGLDLRLARGDLALRRPAAPGPSRRAATCSGATSARSSAAWMAIAAELGRGAGRTGRRPACRRACGRRRGSRCRA